MRNKLQYLMLASAFLMSFSALGVAEPSKSPPPNPALRLNATAGEDHLQSDYGMIQSQDEEAQTTVQVDQMQNQLAQAQGTKGQAAAQAEGSTEQTMQQGVSQTQQIDQQLRQNMTSTAQDMQSTVSITKAG